VDLSPRGHGWGRNVPRKCSWDLREIFFCHGHDYEEIFFDGEFSIVILSVREMCRVLILASLSIISFHVI
jgi:hypothetical protein